MPEPEPKFVAVEDLCLQAKNMLGDEDSFRIRVLIDMILLELEKERVRAHRPDKQA
jgi:hypothetical protein